MMSRLIKYMQCGCLGVMFLFASCMKSELNECPPAEDAYIRFIYDYNLSYEDLFHRQVSKIDLYVFDREGVFLRKLSDEVADEAFPRGYKMLVPEDIRDEANQFIAWAGLYVDNHQATTLTPGVSRIQDLKVKLNSHYNKKVDTKIAPLWHGSLLYADFETDASDNTLTISLTKDTNVFRIILQSLDQSLIDANHFDFRLESVNSAYDYLNDVASTEKWTYQPFLKKNDPVVGSIAELHTMRLMNDRENRLIIKQNTAATPLLDINLNDYLNALKLDAYSSMPLQEYMDREDHFSVMVFLRNDNPLEPDYPNFVSANITINGWEIREQDIAK